MQELEDKIIGNYRILRQVELGGMSEVYLATDRRTGQMVAMKLVHSRDSEYFERFRREIKAMAELRHEHILPVLDYGKQGFWCYMVTPYIEYGTLDRKLRKGPLSLEKAGDFLEQIAGALQFAHSHGVIHRDIKSSNILLKNGRHAYLADFGLAKSVQDRHSLTKTGFVMGTAEYVAPELAETQATPASDIYSLGILLYQMLTGRTPFQAASPFDVFYKHMHDQPTPPSQFNPSLPKPIENIILRALAKNPQERFRTPLEFAQEYQHALAQSQRHIPTIDTTTSTTEPMASPLVQKFMAQKRKKKYLTTAAIIILLIVILLSGAILVGFTIYRIAHPTGLHDLFPVVVEHLTASIL